MNRIGKIFCLNYALVIIICLAFAYLADGDPKGQYVLLQLQLPLALQMSGIHAIGLSSILHGLSWVGAYAILGPPTFLLLYFFGWAIDGLTSNTSNRDA